MQTCCRHGAEIQMRLIYREAERIKVLERIDDAGTYRQIFENLSKAIFIQVSEND